MPFGGNTSYVFWVNLYTLVNSIICMPWNDYAVRPARTASHGSALKTFCYFWNSQQSCNSLQKQTFPSRKEAIDFLSKQKNITKEAAKWRIRHNKINVKSPSKPGKGFCKRKSYKAWSRIKNNYTNPNAKKGYIEGIKLCPRWHDYQKFVEDVGEPPNKYYVFARIDKNKDYEPDNCKWMKQSVAAKLAAIYQRQKAKK